MSLLKSASSISALTLLSRITGMVRDQLMASHFGASAMTDAFNVAFRLPNMFRRLFAEGAFSQAFVPVLGTSKIQNGNAVTRLLIDRVATVLFWILVLTCVVGVLSAPTLMWAMASGLQKNPIAFEAGTIMARWMFPYIGFMSLVALGAGVLNTYKSFTIPAITPVLLNIAMIFAAWQVAPWLETQGILPIYAMVGGVLVGGVMQLLLQMWALQRLAMLPDIAGSWQSICIAWQDPGVKKVAKLMLPALLGVGVAHLSAIINLQIASHLPQEGSVSWMSYAERLMEFPTAMLGVALSAVLTPRLVAAKASQNAQAYSAMLDWGLRLVLMLSLPCTAALLVFSEPLVAVLFHYGKFSANDVHQVTTPMMGYGVGLVGLVAIKILAPGFYASQDMKTPVKIAVGVLVLTQIFNVFLVPLAQHAGLALSIGLAALVNASGLAWGLVRRGNYTPMPQWGLFLLQVVCATFVLAGALAWFAHTINWLDLQAHPVHRMLWLALALLAAGALYFLVLMLMGVRFKSFLKFK